MTDTFIIEEIGASVKSDILKDCEEVANYDTIGEVTIFLKKVALLVQTSRTRFLVTALVVLLSCPFGAPTWAQGSLPLEGKLDPASNTVTLSWPQAERQILGSVTVNRRRLGDSGPTSWEPLGPAETTAVWRDTNVVPGSAFEYQVVRRQQEIVDAGYWIAGQEVPARADNGTVLMLVDEEVADGISLHLDRFQRDLVGAGWRVVTRKVPRHREADAPNFEAALKIREWIAERVAEDPETPHAAILVGHVPILRSGRSAPDGHKAKPHPTDAFYADVDGRWAINSAGVLLNDIVPGNGIELQIGRIDFAPITRADREREVRLLQQYFDKNHHWRHGLLGDLRSAYSGDKRLTVEAHGLLNLVGADNVTSGGHTDVGAEGAWLWGVDFGSHRFKNYFEETGNGSGRAVFAVNFGSNKQLFDRGGNPMAALLAQPWHALAVGWGGRPAWRLHLMALGGTIGEIHRRTLNNGSPDSPYPLGFEYFPMGPYMFRQPVWVNLLGDPTLHAYPLAPPVGPTLHRDGSRGRLSWSLPADGETLGYRVYRLTQDGTHGEPIGGPEPIEAAEARLDAVAEEESYYVRSYGLKETPAGSFYAYSQGAYAIPSEQIPPETLTVEGALEEDGIFIPAIHVLNGRDHLISILQPPESGRIEPVPGGWRYAPAESEPDFLLPIRIFNGQASRSATLEIEPD